MPDFALDSRLQNDSRLVTDLAVCQVRLMNCSDVSWLLLVPKVADAVEWFDLSAQQRQTAEQEITQVAQALKSITQADKINIATLGNVVSQLHIHVIARHKDDCAWPNPVWGNVPMTPLSEIQREKLTSALLNGL